MVRRQVGVVHPHREVCMSKRSLEHDDIAAVHHEVRCERMPQHVGQQTLLKINSSALDAVPERRVRLCEEAGTR